MWIVGKVIETGVWEVWIGGIRGMPCWMEEGIRIWMRCPTPVDSFPLHASDTRRDGTGIPSSGFPEPSGTTFQPCLIVAPALFSGCPECPACPLLVRCLFLHFHSSSAGRGHTIYAIPTSISCPLRPFYNGQTHYPHPVSIPHHSYLHPYHTYAFLRAGKSLSPLSEDRSWGKHSRRLG